MTEPRQRVIAHLEVALANINQAFENNTGEDRPLGQQDMDLLLNAHDDVQNIIERLVPPEPHIEYDHEK